MAELRDIAVSGDISAINLGGTDPKNKVVTQETLENPVETYKLTGPNPNMDMEIADGGNAAQMKVTRLDTGHTVATMAYITNTEEFIFSLYDKDSGASKATFEIKADGKAYIGGKEIATVTPPPPPADDEEEPPSFVSLVLSDPPTREELADAADLAGVTPEYPLEFGVIDLDSGDLYRVVPALGGYHYVRYRQAE